MKPSAGRKKDARSPMVEASQAGHGGDQEQVMPSSTSRRRGGGRKRAQTAMDGEGEGEASEDELVEGFDDGDELDEEEARAIDEFVGDVEPEAGQVASEDELAVLAAQFLKDSAPGEEWTASEREPPEDGADKERKRLEKRAARRKRSRERAKTEKKGNELETTAYVRTFGDDTFSKAELATVLPAEARIRLCGAVLENRSQQAFVQVDTADAMARVLKLHRSKLGSSKLSVRAALTKAGLETLVTRRGKKQAKHRNKTDEPPSKTGTKKRRQADDTPSKTKKKITAGSSSSEQQRPAKKARHPSSLPPTEKRRKREGKVKGKA